MLEAVDFFVNFNIRVSGAEFKFFFFRKSFGDTALVRRIGNKGSLVLEETFAPHLIGGTWELWASVMGDKGAEVLQRSEAESESPFAELGRGSILKLAGCSVFDLQFSSAFSMASG